MDEVEPFTWCFLFFDLDSVGKIESKSRTYCALYVFIESCHLSVTCYFLTGIYEPIISYANHGFIALADGDGKMKRTNVIIQSHSQISRAGRYVIFCSFIGILYTLLRSWCRQTHLYLDNNWGLPLKASPFLPANNSSSFDVGSYSSAASTPGMGSPNN